jgi:hypothetical protein
MKSFILSAIAVFVFSSSLFAQTVLYGTNQIGNGNIVEYDVKAKSLNIIYSFPNDGLSPNTLSELTNGGNGIYYGTTPRGGKWGSGVIFKFDSSSRAYTILYHFNADIAEYPAGKLIQLQDGKLYGIAGGYNVYELEYKQTQGAIFSFDLQTQQLQILYKFPFWIFPIGNIVQGSNGKLYGVASNGLYSYDLTTQTYAFVHNVDGPVRGGLLAATNGKLYGLEDGGIFSLDPVNEDYTIEAYLNEDVGTLPEGTFTREYKGRLYGTTDIGIFSFDLLSKEIQALKSFEPDSNYPQHQFSYDLAIGTDGKLYGMDQFGFYAFDPTTKDYKYLHQSISDLSNLPDQTFITNDTGLIAVNPASSSYELIQRLNAPVGITPQGEIIKGSDGKFYGVVTKGGKYNWGGIFCYDPVNESARILIDLDSWGIQPACPLVEGSDKNLYYTTEFGGGPYHSDSRLVRYNKLLNKIEILHEFPTFTEGNTTNGPLEVGKDGNLYGVTDYAGSFGEIYRYIPENSRFEIIGNLGASYSIKFGKDGKLYGLKEGIIQSFYSFDTSSKILKDFPIPPTVYGGEINHRLALDSEGNFYTSGEGNNAIFKFNPSTETFSNIITLDYLTGNNLSSPLLISSKKILYGSTNYREYKDYYEPPSILQLLSVDATTGIMTPLTFLEGALTFKPSLLLEEKPGSDKLLATIEDTVVYESDLKATVKIILNKPAESSFRLNYKTIPGTATSSGSQKDFIAKSGAVKFSKGSVTGTIQIILKKDKIKEPDETFAISLSKPSILNEPLELKDSVAIVTIKDGERNYNGSHEINIKGNNLLINHSNKDLVAFVYPNPSSYYFTLMVYSKNYNQKIQMMVTDGIGRMIETKSFSTYQLIRFGDNYRKGIYYVQLIQNNEKVVFKLIKS